MPAPSRSANAWWLVAALVVGSAGGAYLWKRSHSSPPSIAPPSHIEPPTPAAPPPAAATTPPPRILHPIAPTAAPKRGPLPGLDDADAHLRNLVVELLGRKAVLAFVTLDGFARRSVATVNNLATDNAAAEMWPIKPTPGRLVTEAAAGAGATVIGARNADRYAPFVHLVEGIDARQAVELYVRVYPILQRAYEELGFPDQYLNDRVIAVIDNLLATPEVAGPIRVKPIEVAGVETPASAGHLYVFDDPALEASTAGQKILLRTGPENARRLKAKLSTLREHLLAQAPEPIPGKKP